MITRKGSQRFHVACPYCNSVALTGYFPRITFPRANGSFSAEPEETLLRCVRCWSEFSLADANWREIVTEERMLERGT